MNRKTYERFICKIEKTNTCWIWKAQIYPNGYGAFHIDGKNSLAHRASWMLHKGQVPKNKIVCHKCDNRKCVNPDHLFLGSYKDNTEDMIKKGRHAIQKQILDNIQKREVIKMYLNHIAQREIAKYFKVHQRTIWRIIHKIVPVKKCIGEENNKSILTEEKVKQMREIYNTGKMGFYKIAKKFSVDKSTAMRAIKGITWKHI